jgi:prepilin-type processing-associated H-X9-DG protein
LVSGSNKKSPNFQQKLADRQTFCDKARSSELLRPFKHLIIESETSVHGNWESHDVQDPSRAPTFGDGIVPVNAEEMWGPKATDFPAVKLASGYGGTGFLLNQPGMAAFTIPRHGSRLSNVSTNFPPNQKLKSAINMSFYDGHVEQIKLEKLWQLYWHRDYKVPAKRPGL